MRITLNGEGREVSEGHTIGALLAELGLQAARVAVEVNHAILDRSAFEGTVLHEGDRIEVIGFIGGGGKRCR